MVASVPRVLTDFDRREAISLSQAAYIAGKTVETVRGWAALHDIGRKIGGRWAISHPVLLMWLDADKEALKAYWAGDRQSETVARYFKRAGVPLPTEAAND